MRSCGRIATYNAGCRCEDCRAASAEYARTRRVNRAPSSTRNRSGHPDELDPMPWTEHAACRDYPPQVFFPHGGPRAYDLARQVCAGCPVRQDCLDYALRTRQTDGCWGGLTPDEREMAASA